MPRLSHRTLVVSVAAFLMAGPAAVSGQSTETHRPPVSSLTHRFAERDVTSADGTRIAYLVAGTGRPLVMVHGSMTVADEWLAVADRLAATRRVVVVARRGRGRSGDAPVHSVAIESQDLAAVVADVARTSASGDASTGPVDLFGHSYGGAVVGRYAIDARFPAAVVLYDPGAGLNGPIADARLDPVRALLAAGQRDSATAVALANVMGMPAPAIDAMRQNTTMWTQFRTLLPSWIREIESLTAFAPSATEFGRIRGRTTILLGEKSGPMLLGMSGTWVGRQPGITVLPLRGQGHTAYTDAVPYIVERIQAALAQ